MAKIKYLGSADKRVLRKGDDWGGRLADPLEDEVVFDHENHFIVDSEEANLSDEALELVLEDPDFRDVSDLKTIPLSVAETQRRGDTGRVDAEDVPELRTAESDSGTKKAKNPSASSRTGETTSTGGSTPSATTAGGSTTSASSKS